MNFDPYVARIVPDSVLHNNGLTAPSYYMPDSVAGPVIAYYRSDAVQWEVAYLFEVTELVPTIAIYQFDDDKLLFFSPIDQYEFDILDAFGIPHLDASDIQITYNVYRPQVQIREDATSMNWSGAMIFHALPVKQIKGSV
jgi:hypothetical protein